MEEDSKQKDHAYARQEALSRLIQECLDSHETGLSLATAETGSGKSFTVADIIAKRFRKAIDRGEDISEMKFVYLTNRVADRDGWYEKELLPALEREDVNGLVRTKNLPSMRDVAIENMTALSDGKLGVVEGALEALPDSVKNSSQKKTLANEVMNYCVAYNAVLAGDAAPEAKKTAMDHVADAERSFRKLVSREAAKAKKALEEAENGGREGKKMDWDQFFLSEKGAEWEWIKGFWRTYDTKDANILVATYKKAFYSIDPIAGSPFTIANPEYLSKCEALFIDEIDAFYKILLDHYIEQALDYVCDLPEHIAATSRALHAALTVVNDGEESYLTDLIAALPQDDKIPSRIMDLQTSSPALPASYMLLRECVFLNVHGVSNKNVKTMLGAIKGLENVDRLLVELCEEFNLSAQHVDLTSENETAGFIFMDPIRERPVLSSEARSLAVERHAAENRIVKAADAEDRDDSSPTMMLKRLRGANRSLQHALCSAVLAMRACYSEALEKKRRKRSARRRQPSRQGG